MGIKKFISPAALPFDYQEWKQKKFADRVTMLCQAWAIQGYGAPVSVYTFYLLKIALYIGMWVFFCSQSESLGNWSNISDWFFRYDAIGKAILWSMLFEVLGLGCGSGPLTARYLPPVVAFTHWLRPGTIKMPLFPKIPMIGSDKRNLLDVALYLCLILALLINLMSKNLVFDQLIYVIILLPVLGILDKTIFLAARAEHFFVGTICLLFPEYTFAALKWVWLAIWFWAATSKLNKHFPSVICVMISNSAFLRIPWLRKKIYKDYPHDLRQGKLAEVLAHLGTLTEYIFPLLLIFGDGGSLTIVGLTIMFFFHLYITASVPMAVPLEWNFIMVYGAFVLFGHHVDVSMITAFQDPILTLVLVSFLLVIPIIGNFFPKYVSFLLSMRYYAGNWAYSVWLFKDDNELKLDKCLVKSSASAKKQLMYFYDEDTTDSLIAKVIAFRSMHLHGRVLQNLVPKAVEDIERYEWRDGELVTGLALGWNFGDGHLSNEQLLKSIQKRCTYESGELRCIIIEAQPFLQPRLKWRIVDAKDGELDNGVCEVSDLLKLQPYS